MPHSLRYWRHRLGNSLRRCLSGLGFRGECVWPGAKTDLFVAHLSIYEFAASRIDGGAVLDAGCGTGYGSARLAAVTGARVLGVDVDPRSIRYARAHFSGPGVRFAVQDLQELDMEPETLDFVVSSNVPEHLEDPERFLRALRSVLKPDGRILLVMPAITDEHSLAENEKIPYHVSNLTVREWVALFESLDFGVRVFRHVYPPGLEKLDFASPLPSTKSPGDFEFVEAEVDDLYGQPTLGGVYLLSKS